MSDPDLRKKKSVNPPTESSRVSTKPSEPENTACSMPPKSNNGGYDSWVEAYQEIQRQTVETHLTFQKTMAEAHTAFRKHAEMTNLMVGTMGANQDVPAVEPTQLSNTIPSEDELQSDGKCQGSEIAPPAPGSTQDKVPSEPELEQGATPPKPVFIKGQSVSESGRTTAIPEPVSVKTSSSALKTASVSAAPTKSAVSVKPKLRDQIKRKRKPVKYDVCRAEEKDSDDLNKLMRSVSQQSNLWEVITERQPNFFNSIMTLTSIPAVWIGRHKESNLPVGCASTGFRDVYVNGKRESIRYASDIRIHEDHRGGQLLSLIFMHGARELKPLEMLQTHIIAENEKSLAALAKQYMYYEYGDFHMHMIAYFGISKPPIDSKYYVRKAMKSDIGAMQVFFNEQAPKKQFYPHYDFHKIGTDDPYYRDIILEDYYLAFDGNELVGISGLWDQKGFKQTLFTNYHKTLRILRPLYNAYAKLFRAFQFPAEGKPLHVASLHTILTKDNDVEIFKVILREVFRGLKKGKHKAFGVGLSPEDPLNEAVNDYRRITYLGKHFLMRFDGDPRTDLDLSRTLYLEFSRL